MTRWPVIVLAIGVLSAVAAESYVLFAGAYVPYIDWSNHLGLIAILGHGSESGALEYAERSLAPRPYLLFYAVAAAASFLVAVPAAAKTAFVAAAALSVMAMGALLRALGRPVVAAPLAPLALYGYARGYGFSSFVFTVPFLLLVLASFEHLLTRIRDERPAARAAVGFGTALLLCYLGHALWALPAAGAVATRGAVFMAVQPRSRAWRMVRIMALAVGPSIVCAAIAWNDLGPERAGVTLHREGPGIFLWGTSLARRWNGFGGHLLERGSPAHWTTMYGVAWLLVILFAAAAIGMLRARSQARTSNWTFTQGDQGALVYAMFFGLLYAVGPESIGWPMGVWMVYPRYATVGALLLFLLPRPRLGLAATVLSTAAAVALVAHNASVNHRHVAGFSALARRYDAVRAAVPPRSTVLALTSRDPGDWIGAHHALGSLYFYHLCDGAAYSAFLFDNPLLPVRMKPERPQAPPWNRVGQYRPDVHGTAFDYLVLRGRRFVDPTARAGRHEVVLRHQGWVVFKTLPPKEP